TDSGNYSFNTTASASADLTQRALTVTASGQNKVYDGTTTATVTLGDNRVAGDVLTASGTANFVDRNAGSGKAVSVTSIGLSGADALNYSFNATAATSANITPRPITVTAQTDTKTYDGATSSAAAPQITSGALQTGDTTTTFSQSFDTRNAGSG